MYNKEHEEFLKERKRIAEESKRNQPFLPPLLLPDQEESTSSLPASDLDE